MQASVHRFGPPSEPEVGQIIVADVNRARIAELLAPDRQALGRLIRKEG